MNFRQLVDDCRVRGLKPHQEPETLGELADRIGISRKYLWELRVGRRFGSLFTVRRIASALHVRATRVHRALEETRKQAGR